MRLPPQGCSSPRGNRQESRPRETCIYRQVDGEPHLFPRRSTPLQPFAEHYPPGQSKDQAEHRDEHPGGDGYALQKIDNERNAQTPGEGPPGAKSLHGPRHKQPYHQARCPVNHYQYRAQPVHKLDIPSLRTAGGTRLPGLLRHYIKELLAPIRRSPSQICFDKLNLGEMAEWTRAHTCRANRRVDSARIRMAPFPKQVFPPC
jgi:hypothetical protein